MYERDAARVSLTAGTQLASIDAIIPAIEREADAARNALSLLTGAEPHALDVLLDDAAAGIPQIAGPVAIGLPAQLVRNRPDIAAAEADLPLAGFAMWAVWWGIPQDLIRLERFRLFDSLGFVTGIASSAMLVVALDQGERLDWFHSPLIVWLLSGGLALFVVFLVSEWYHHLPFVNLQLLERRNLWLAFVIFVGMLVVLLSGSLLPADQLAPIGLAIALPGLAPQGVLIEQFGSIRDIPHFDQDVLDGGIAEPVATMAKAICAADGVIIVTPEYNYSVPGVLKNALDWLSGMQPPPFAQKPVARHDRRGTCAISPASVARIPGCRSAQQARSYPRLRQLHQLRQLRQLRHLGNEEVDPGEKVRRGVPRHRVVSLSPYNGGSA